MNLSELLTVTTAYRAAVIEAVAGAFDIHQAGQTGKTFATGWSSTNQPVDASWEPQNLATIRAAPEFHTHRELFDLAGKVWGATGPFRWRVEQRKADTENPVWCVVFAAYVYHDGATFEVEGREFGEQPGTEPIWKEFPA